MAEWLRRWPCANIALRYPAGVVGLDVDDYDGKPAAGTLAEREVRLGGLPPTWIVTSRDDGVSGTRLYQVELGSRWRDGLEGGGVDITQRSHRYSVIPPSLHPQGSAYRLLSPTGQQTLSWPRPSELPHLPTPWQQALRARVHRRPGRQPRDPSGPQGLAARLVDSDLVEFAREGIRTGRATASGQRRRRHAYARALLARTWEAMWEARRRGKASAWAGCSTSRPGPVRRRRGAAPPP